MKILQKGFNYSQDGPGNRLVYHLQGCNFACKWCSNADSIPLNNNKAKDISVECILDEVLRSKMMFFDGGGVTFTGGEVCLQSEELIRILKLLKKNNINTCIETNGSLNELKTIAEYVDYLIMDFKHFDESEHKYWTGGSNVTTIENLTYFFKMGRQLHIRIPVINNVNVFPDRFAEFFSEYNTDNAVFEFLAYHEYGKDKWKGKYQINDGFVSRETIIQFEETFKQYGLKTIRT